MAKVPLSGSTNGAPIPVGTSLTLIETSPATGSVFMRVTASNTSGQPRDLTIDIGGAQFTVVVAANESRAVNLSISAGDSLQMLADAVGVNVIGVAEPEPRYVS